jgi:hypothetical protein
MQGRWQHLQVLNDYNSDNPRVGSVKQANQWRYTNPVMSYWGLNGRVPVGSLIVVNEAYEGPNEASRGVSAKKE